MRAPLPCPLHERPKETYLRVQRGESMNGDLSYGCGKCGLCGPWGASWADALRKWNALARLAQRGEAEGGGES